ncbi:O-succinylhomoserine sulfhydrylase [Candidatus Terasakiella magnetica]|uniref:O-succinylhomoserine sulfhydrylase n=1 Tax=Candidatus Terasakiella magnetica TaxID=1867952 RepID=A0A1C3RIR8_9PROT|nr:O-succinylhomoserine sulfhydrylase [Candidatus Terasakiella magnetica]SCA57167.1 O-succinylhomoserine sulfhydrylase [Candidatus Terasakiella magnetica]
MSKTTWRTSTQLVHGGIKRSAFDENCEGLFVTSGYIYASAEEQEATFKEEIKRYQYSRFANPTVGMFEERMAMIEGANFCLATATGMAAINTTLMAMLKSGDRVVASRALFGSSVFIMNNILPRFGIETVLVDGDDLNQWEEALKKPTRAVLLETPSNPTLDIVDMQSVADLAHKAGARVIVDNVFATPILQKPLDFGADVVVYSTTKYVDGQGRTMGGAILFNEEKLLKEEIMPYFRNTGPAMSPFNAWTQLKGLETMDMRVMKHCENATLVAKFLENLKGVTKVNYPGLHSHPQHDLAMKQMKAGGPMLSFEIDGGKDKAFAFENALELTKICNNLGDSKSLITHPGTTTHSKVEEAERLHLGISDGLLRLSVGLEDADDLKEDLAQASKTVFG